MKEEIEYTCKFENKKGNFAMSDGKVIRITFNKKYTLHKMCFSTGWLGNTQKMVMYDDKKRMFIVDKHILSKYFFTPLELRKNRINSL